MTFFKKLFGLFKGAVAQDDQPASPTLERPEPVTPSDPAEADAAMYQAKRLSSGGQQTAESEPSAANVHHRS